MSQNAEAAELEASKRSASYYGDTTKCAECGAQISWVGFGYGEYGYADHWGVDVCRDPGGTYWKHEPV